MGEAKRRGTREVRVAQAIEADAAYHAELRRKADEAEARHQQKVAERWAKMPPEEKERRVAIATREASAMAALISSPVGGLLATMGVLLARPATRSDTRTAALEEVPRD